MAVNLLGNLLGLPNLLWQRLGTNPNYFVSQLGLGALPYHTALHLGDTSQHCHACNAFCGCSVCVLVWEV